MPTFLQVFVSRKMAVTLLSGFSCGIPLALTGSTLQAWMATEKVDLTVIGIFSLVGLPYTFKYLWAPLMDRYVPPFLGRRRGWMIVCQFALMLVIAAMAFADPAGSPGVVALLAVLTAFFSSSQDIAADAYRTEVLDPDERGAGAALNIMGYRIAMLTSGAVALILSDQLPWKMVYLIMSGTLGLGILATLIAPNPTRQNPPPKSLAEGVIHPFVDFFRRPGAIEVLAFIVLYKLGDVMAAALTTPFMMQIGFTRTDIGAVTKGFGMVATILGALAGGSLMVRLGMNRSLWLFGILQAVSNFTFMALAMAGHNYSMMVTAITVENLCGGMGTAAFTAFLMSQCNQRYTATQYALLSSLMAVARVFAGAPTGYLAKSLGWEQYFLICTIAAVPGLLLLLRFSSWRKPESIQLAT